MLCLMVSFLFLVFLGIFLRRVSSFASPFHPFFLVHSSSFVLRVCVWCSVLIVVHCSMLVFGAQRLSSFVCSHARCSSSYVFRCSTFVFIHVLTCSMFMCSNAKHYVILLVQNLSTSNILLVKYLQPQSFSSSNLVHLESSRRPTSG